MEWIDDFTFIHNNKIYKISNINNVLESTENRNRELLKLASPYLVN